MLAPLDKSSSSRCLAAQRLLRPRFYHPSPRSEIRLHKDLERSRRKPALFRASTFLPPNEPPAICTRAFRCVFAYWHRLYGCQIRERDRPDESLILVHHRQAPHPPIAHLLRYILGALALEAIKQLGGHRLPDSDRIRIATVGHEPNGKIVGGDHADQLIVFVHREHLTAKIGH